MQRGQAWFITYYRFLALRRHCSVGFRWLALKGGTLERGMLERGTLERGTLERGTQKRGMLFFTFFVIFNILS
jgi:hypothetical protein